MICPVSAITMSKVWDTAVTDRLSRDTMNERTIKRRAKSSKSQKLEATAGDLHVFRPAAEAPDQPLFDDDESDLAS
jgi:formate hydrogenlyase subunit 6/NADH:ubiquinone oxidoreductase subunit I